MFFWCCLCTYFITILEVTFKEGEYLVMFFITIKLIIPLPLDSPQIVTWVIEIVFLFSAKLLPKSVLMELTLTTAKHWFIQETLLEMLSKFKAIFAQGTRS